MRTPKKKTTKRRTPDPVEPIDVPAIVSGVPLPPAPPPKYSPTPDGRGRRRYTIAEGREIGRYVEQALLLGHGEYATRRQLRMRWPGIGLALVKKHRNRIREAWRQEDEQARSSNKATQLRAIRADMEHARGERKTEMRDGVRVIVPGEWTRAPNHSALARYHHLIAQIEGNYEPLRISVDVQVQESVMLVIGGMRPEQLDTLLAEAQEDAELAAAARRIGLLPQ